jgi:2-phosphoglycerate kinase
MNMEFYLMNKPNWTLLIIGGASCTGKSTIANKIARHYGINVLEFDDIHIALKSVVKPDRYPAISDINGENWESLGVDGNVNWLIDVSREMSVSLKALVERHLEDKLPIIIEGDFIIPELVKPLLSDQVKAFFIQESDKDQIMKNNHAREGWSNSLAGDIYVFYNDWLRQSCEEVGIDVLESGPWETALNRAIELLDMS